MILERLGIYGWPEGDENLLLASLLTGDPLLLIGRHGSAKTVLAVRIARALGKRFVAYDASKALFEDVLGYPNLEQLKRGVVEYIPGPLTVWDKEMVLIDELNRALPELQSKWLEIIRSRRIMGLPTQLKWVWAAMNPPTYAGTQALDGALLGRFALFVTPPDVLAMTEEDRIKVTQAMTEDDAPALAIWLGESGLTVPHDEGMARDVRLPELLRTAARHFSDLRVDLEQLPLFLSRLATLLHSESGGQIALDGRRLGFLQRHILAYRAVELARAGAGSYGRLPALIESVRHVLQAGIPLGLDETLPDGEQARHQLDLCCDLLAGFFQAGSQLAKMDAVYELCTTSDLRRQVEILLREDLGELASCRGWQSLVTGEADITALAYIALQVEAQQPGRIPAEMLAGLSGRIAPANLSSQALPPLQGEAIEHLDQVEDLLREAEGELETVVTLARLGELLQEVYISRERIQATRERVGDDLTWLREMIGSQETKGANGP